MFFPKLHLVHWLPLLALVTAYQVPFTDTDYSRQICSGMWGSQSTYINVTFDAASQGQVAMVMYEWADSPYLGKVTVEGDELNLPKTYVCTSNAVANGYCGTAELGRFIVDLPSGRKINDTTFWSARVHLPASPAPVDEQDDDVDVSAKGLWIPPDGKLPTPPDNNYTSPWRRRHVAFSQLLRPRDNFNPSPAGVLVYTEPIQYLVRKTGYYCVAIVPVTVQNNARAATDVPFHPSYNGLVYFRNTFDGKLAATDYPKVNFYFVMFLVYTAFAAAWGWLCYKNLQDLLPLQYYLSGLVGLLVIEMVANWAYYRYLNAHGKSTASTVFLIVVAILDAGRNSMSFFMLLVVSLGLSVVRESLDRTMLKCQLLAGAHFIFGILYAVGIVELEYESASALVLLLFVIPLAFTLNAFLLWIMYALNGTIAQLRARKQRYKLSMFEKLHKILIGSVVIIAIFFVVSSFSFSGRLAEDYAAKSWKLRWWLLDAWLALLYLVSFSAIAYLWRPSENNRRSVSFLYLFFICSFGVVISTLAMSDEIAQDEEDAEDYDMEALENRTRARDDDEATLVGDRRQGGRIGLVEDSVVFEIGDEDDEDDTTPSKKRHNSARLSGERRHSGDEERRGLIGGDDDDRHH